MIYSLLITMVAAVPMNQIMHTMYKGQNQLDRSRRAYQEMDMCSYRMQNITRLAETAGQIFMTVDDSPLYRKTRNHVSFVNLEQPVGSFCMKLWRKLVKVHADLQTLSYTMHSYNFVSRSVEFLIEALQEQMNIENVSYEDFAPATAANAGSRLNIDLVRERSQVQLSHIINELKSLDLTCNLRRKRMI